MVTISISCNVASMCCKSNEQWLRQKPGWETLWGTRIGGFLTKAAFRNKVIASLGPWRSQTAFGLLPPFLGPPFLSSLDPVSWVDLVILGWVYCHRISYFPACYVFFASYQRFGIVLIYVTVPKSMELQCRTDLQCLVV